jgi:hypothetical protein
LFEKKYIYLIKKIKNIFKSKKNKKWLKFTFDKILKIKLLLKKHFFNLKIIFFKRNLICSYYSWHKICFSPLTYPIPIYIFNFKAKWLNFMYPFNYFGIKLKSMLKVVWEGGWSLPNMILGDSYTQSYFWSSWPSKEYFFYFYFFNIYFILFCFIVCYLKIELSFISNYVRKVDKICIIKWNSHPNININSLI